MNTLERATRLNNKGAYLLESNSIVSAIQVLQSGLQSIKAYAHEAGIGATESKRPIPTPCVDDIYFRVTVGTKLVGLQDEYFYTYNRPLLLNLGSTIPVNSDIIETPKDVYVATVVIIFNLALAYHHHAKKCGLTSSIKHAIKMYRLAIKMADCMEIDQFFGKALTCFTLNNLANLHSNLCEYEASKYCLKCIKDSFWNDAHIDVFVIDFLEEEEWVEIKLNCLYGHSPVAAQAA
jgi:hypothetical protein